MRWSLAALLIGFGLDLLLGDPRGVPHPVALIGKLISALERMLRRSFPQTAAGERWAGGVLWVLTAGLSLLIPALLLWACRRVSPWLALAAQSVMSWQILAVLSLREESMKVYTALESGDLEASRRAVSWIVGRDTERLDEAGVARAAVETVAENTSDGVVAPLFFLALGGAPLGFFYKAVNTMDSMLGYVEPPYRNSGLVPAKMDDVLNFLPARLAALLMLAAGGLLGLDVGGGWRIFRRDRHNHASPNSAQTESVCAGLLGLRLAGDAWYHGVRHEKPFIGDERRAIEHADIPRACRLMYGTALLALRLPGKRLGGRGWAGLFVGLLGVLMVTRDVLAWGDAPLWAYCLPLLGMLSLAVATLWQKRMHAEASLGLLPSLWLQCAVSAVAFAGLAGREGSLMPVASVGFAVSVSWTVVLSTLGGYGLYWACLRRSSPTRVASVLYLSPAVTLLWAWTMFGEPLSWLMLVGTGVSGLGIWLVARSERALPAGASRCGR